MIESWKVRRALHRKLNWVHIPVPRERDDIDYFAPSSELDLDEGTELYLVLIHLADGVPGANRRIASAGSAVTGFGVVTECGFGRRPLQSIRHLLGLHRDLLTATHDEIARVRVQCRSSGELHNFHTSRQLSALQDVCIEKLAKSRAHLLAALDADTASMRPLGQLPHGPRRVHRLVRTYVMRPTIISSCSWSCMWVQCHVRIRVEEDRGGPGAQQRRAPPPRATPGSSVVRASHPSRRSDSGVAQWFRRAEIRSFFDMLDRPGMPTFLARS